jgi:hypothetical protein
LGLGLVCAQVGACSQVVGVDFDRVVAPEDAGRAPDGAAHPSPTSPKSPPASPSSTLPTRPAMHGTALGKASVATGTLAIASFTPVESFAFGDPTAPDNHFILISSRAGICQLRPPQEFGNFREVLIMLAHMPWPLPPGTYPLKGFLDWGEQRADAGAYATLLSANAQCESTPDDATGGTLMVAASGSRMITGSYDVAAPDGTLSGTFAAGYCDAPGPQDAGTTACLP